MQNILSVENMRMSDAATIKNTTPSLVLMERAGRAVFDSVEWRAPVAIVCGSGNNAGDGYVLALLLREKGIDCRLFLLSDKFSPDGKHYFDKAVANGVPFQYFTKDTSLCGYATVVDCILGTGFRGKVTGCVRDAISAINKSGAYTVSVDINSGLCGDCGCGELCVSSDLTVSIGSYKPAHFLGRAKDVIKAKVNADIGIAPLMPPYKLFEAQDAADVLPHRENISNKSTYGYVALIGGSQKFSGAIRLAAMANCAMRAGAGVATVAAPASLSPYIIPSILEATLLPLSERDGELAFDEHELEPLIHRYRAIAIGMGIGLSDGARDILLYLLSNYKGTLIVDADALTLLSRMDTEVIRSSPAQIVMTPHNMEFSRLTSLSIQEIMTAPIEHAREYAKTCGCTLLLKGPTTIITDGERVFLVEKGCAGMATAGSGDVLSGVLCAVCGYAGDDITLATAAAAYINGLAGELAQNEFGSVSMIASDTVHALPKAIGILTNTHSEMF